MCLCSLPQYVIIINGGQVLWYSLSVAFNNPCGDDTPSKKAL